MTPPEDRLLAILADRDAPARDDAFVSAVMAQVESRPVPRPAALPAFAQPLARIAPLLALATVAPFLIQGAGTALAASDPKVVAVSLALALTAWMVLGAFRRSGGPVLAT
jgi:hypothetical protein